MLELRTMIVIAGALIVGGLILLVVGNHAILEGVTQKDGKVSSNQALTVSMDLNMQKTPKGVFVVQVMEFKDDTFSATVLDPLGMEIVSQRIDKETVEKEFDILESGSYRLIIESSSNEEIQVLGAVGHLPDESRKAVNLVSVGLLIGGMITLVGSGIYGIKNKTRSV